jgi:hypothetical protein
MKLEITPEEVLELASKNYDFKKILEKKFPDCFKEGNGEFCFKSSDGYFIKDDEKYFTVHQKDAFVKEYLAKSTVYYANDWGHIRFKEEKNAYAYMIENNKRKFSILEIEHACNHSNISKGDTKKLIEFFQTRIL